MGQHANMVKVTAASPGTGSVTVSTAVSGFRTFAQGYNSADATVAGVRIEDASDATIWEIDENCAYTHSGTTLSRGTRTDSSTGGAVNFTGSVIVSVIATAGFGNDVENAKQTYIRGLIVTKNSGGNTLDISAGACYDPSSNKIISYAGATGVSAGTLGASQWNQVYIYDNAGTATIQVVNNAAPPSTTYAGTARQGGTTITNKRWIGSFLTSSGSNIYKQDVKETGDNSFSLIWNELGLGANAPFRIVSAGTAADFATSGEVSFVAAMPRYVCTELFCNMQLNLSTTAAANAYAQTSIDGTNMAFQAETYIGTTGLYPAIDAWIPIAPSTPGLWYSIVARSPGVAPNIYIDVIGYRAAR